MPIPVLGVEVPTPEIPGEGNNPPVVEIKPSYRRRISWIYPAMSVDAPTRSEILLTGDISGVRTGIIVQPGVKGLDSAPISLTLDELPALDGSVFRHSRKTTREVMLPLFFWAPDRASLISLKRQILRALDTGDAPGSLSVTEYNGDGEPSTRYLDCYYTSGMEGDETQGYDFVCQTFGLVVQAPDPFWYASKVTPPAPDQFDSTVPVSFFTGLPVNTPGTGDFFPLHLSKSTYVGDKTYVIANPGDIDAWPVWSIKGTGAKSVSIEHIASGRTIFLSYSFASASDVVRIDTRPGFKTLTNSAGDNLWPFAAPETSMFQLSPGNNDIRIDFEPATEGSVVSIQVEYSFYPRYLGA